MKIQKSQAEGSPKIVALRAKFPGFPEPKVDADGKLSVRVSGHIADENGDLAVYQVILSDGEIERILDCLANPKDAETSKAISKAMSGSLQSLVRLTAFSAGTMPDK
ncbi:MAG: hypothetical protein KA735_11285 [Burkholderiaceae bacterium]|nr:hypothetical protein [Burkholderiaceae bacterium]